MQFVKVASAAGIALAGMLTLTACNAEDNVAVVNGVPIPQARMEYVVKSQVQQGQQDSEQLRKQVKDVLITRELLTQAAVQKGLDKSPEVITGVDMAMPIEAPMSIRCPSMSNGSLSVRARRSASHLAS